ncbi:hypothetical protein Pelo_106 [Pelomyxa schiedti]|nr:hypothetical protein Pelo_106 [Pelomyxa schiedti]
MTGWAERPLLPDSDTYSGQFAQCGVADARCYYLFPRNDYSVGRLGCDIIVGDRSVSRWHALIHVGDPKEKAVIEVKDRSKFGTYKTTLSGYMRIEPKAWTLVHSGETLRVRAGVVTYDPLLATHLITPEIIVTEKILIALSRAIPIVSPEWVFEMTHKDYTLVHGLPDFVKYMKVAYSILQC